jgi:hypothetical protein
MPKFLLKERSEVPYVGTTFKKQYVTNKKATRKVEVLVMIYNIILIRVIKEYTGK